MAKLIQVSNNLKDYLVSTEYSDYNQPNLKEKSKTLFQNCATAEDKIRTAFLFVRDEIAHSGVIHSHQITIFAQDVLQNRHGICHAKANLFTALLRFAGIPSGFCYQRLSFGTSPDTFFCLHGITAVFLPKAHCWRLLDASIKIPGMNDSFSLSRDLFAFSPRQNISEKNYPFIFAKPLPSVLQAMKRYTDCCELLRYGLPSEIPENELPK